MTHPNVDGLAEQGAYVLLHVFEWLARSRSPGLARWAGSVADALLARLASIAAGEPVLALSEPVSMSDLDDADILTVAPWLNGLHVDDDDTERWLTECALMMRDEYRRRQHEKGVIRAKFDAVAAEEMRIERESKPPPDLRGLPKWSELSRPPAE